MAAKAKKSVKDLQRAGVPIGALASYGRLWQLERWLRQLVHLNYKSLYGSAWRPKAIGKATKYQGNENLVQLLSTDKSDELAFLDFPELNTLIGQEWPYFEPFLINRATWDGSFEELKQVRRRVGHMRLPADGDLRRLETILQALEPGVKTLLNSLNTELNVGAIASWSVADYGNDATRKAFDASSTLDHLRKTRNHHTDLNLHALPWAQHPTAASNITTTSGFLWGFEMSNPDVFLDVAAFSGRLTPSVCDQLIYCLHHSPSGIYCYFPAVNDAIDTIAAIEEIASAFSQSALQLKNVGKPRIKKWIKAATGVHHQVLASGQTLVDYDGPADEGYAFLAGKES